MAEDQQISVVAPQNVSGKTVLYASLAGVAVAGPLLGMMGFTFLATLTLLLITSPLLIIFSPLLLFAAFVVGVAVVGIAAAVTMAAAGVSAFAWSFRSFREGGWTESGEKVKEKGKEWAGYLMGVTSGSDKNDVNRG